MIDKLPRWYQTARRVLSLAARAVCVAAPVVLVVAWACEHGVADTLLAGAVVLAIWGAGYGAHGAQRREGNE